MEVFVVIKLVAYIVSIIGLFLFGVLFSSKSWINTLIKIILLVQAVIGGLVIMNFAKHGIDFKSVHTAPVVINIVLGLLFLLGEYEGPVKYVKLAKTGFITIVVSGILYFSI